MHAYPARLLVSAAFAASFIATAVRADDTTSSSLPCGTCFAWNATDQKAVFVPLESTEVVLEINPAMVEAEITQTFSNRTDTALEATYRYPLPPHATLTSFELRYPGHVVKSVVREKAAAKATYEAAKAEGRKAALLEQLDPALFSTAVANFLPGEKVQVVLRYIQPVELAADGFEVRFPMVTGEKYFPGDATPGQPGNAAPTPLKRPAGMLAENHVYAFDIHVSGVPVRSITSESHAIRVERVGNNGDCLVSLAKEITIPDRDFVLRVNTQLASTVATTVVTEHTATGDYGLFTVFPPAAAPRLAVPRPRDVLFLIDHSGSMEGARIESARRGLLRCLNALNPADRFQIVQFDSTYDLFQPTWVPAAPDELAVARAYVKKIEARGGTEMQPALSVSLDMFAGSERDQIVVFLTDGDVGNETSLFNLIERKLGHVRLFTFGIGAAPNATLLKKMAELGRGQARFISDDGSIEHAMADLFATLDAAVLSDVQVTMRDASGAPLAYDAFPSTLPDVFLHHPIQAVYRTHGGQPAQLEIAGKVAEQPISFIVPVRGTNVAGDGLEKHFGQELYADTESLLRRATTEAERDPIRKELLDTALQFQLVTELTSRVAVDESIARAPSAPLVTNHVAQYSAADQANTAAVGSGTGGVPIMGADGEEYIQLQPFEVSAGADNGYTAASTLAGNRINTSLRDIGNAVSIVTKEFLRNVGAKSPEAALAYLSERGAEPELAAQGNFAATTNGLPLSTVVDRATIDAIEIDFAGSDRGDLRQPLARAGRYNQLELAAGDEGYVAATLTANTRISGDPILGIFSATHFGTDRWSAYLNGVHDQADTQVAGTLQWHHLAGYGDARELGTTFRYGFSNDEWCTATLAWHRLDRQHPEQFNLGSTYDRFDGLGLWNLDLLTAETRRLEDRIAQIQVGGSAEAASLKHTVALALEWHEQDSDWTAALLTPSLLSTTRQHARLAATYHVTTANDRLGVTVTGAQARDHTTHEIGGSDNTREVSMQATAELGAGVSLFGRWFHDETLPGVSSGRFDLSGGRPVAIANPVEHRNVAQLGLQLACFGNRLNGSIALYREAAHDVSYRDWQWEADHAAATVAPGSNTVRLPMSFASLPAATREGIAGSLTFEPTAAFHAKASWDLDWLNRSVYRGGAARASILGRYDFRHGAWRGVFLGAGASYRDDLEFNDGYRLNGGVRCDAFVGYRLGSGRRETTFQLNVRNLTDRPWQPTRFANDHGREFLVTVTRNF